MGGVIVCLLGAKREGGKGQGGQTLGRHRRHSNAWEDNWGGGAAGVQGQGTGGSCSLLPTRTAHAPRQKNEGVFNICRRHSPFHVLVNNNNNNDCI